MKKRRVLNYELHSHPEGRWLLRVGNRSYAVEPTTGQRLQEQGVGPDLQFRLERPGSNRAGRAIRLRLTLLPASIVLMIARQLKTLSNWSVLMVMSFFGIGVAVAAFVSGGLVQGIVTVPDLCGSLILLLFLNLIHEMGHASALSRSGYPPGRIGFGWILVLPVLFCDVSAVGLLGRAGRIRVDIAGICFQLGGIGLLVLSGLLLQKPAPGLAALGGLLSVAWSLLPVMKVDGYWLLCDALQIDNLETPPAPDRLRAYRLARFIYRVVQLFVVSRVIWFVIKLIRRAWVMVPNMERSTARAIGLSLLLLIVISTITLYLVRRRSPSDPRA